MVFHDDGTLTKVIDVMCGWYYMAQKSRKMVYVRWTKFTNKTWNLEFLDHFFQNILCRHNTKKIIIKCCRCICSRMYFRINIPYESLSIFVFSGRKNIIVAQHWSVISSFIMCVYILYEKKSFYDHVVKPPESTVKLS